MQHATTSPWITADTPLVRAPNLEVVLKSCQQVAVRSPSGSIHGGPLGIDILDVFARPVTIRGAMESLKPKIKSSQMWIEVAAAIQRFREAGVLLPNDEAKLRLHHKSGNFDSPGVHTAMLNDRTRTDAFLRAIRRIVRPEHVVVDIGTGTGVLAVAAARAGARHVVAVEAGDIANVAEAVFEANGLQDRITLVRGRSTQVDLPERADVLVSEIIGNEPLGESIIETFVDARRRLLKPGASLIPRCVRVMGLPVEIPRETIDRKTFTRRSLANWRDWYGIDFSPLADYGRASSHQFSIKSHDVRSWTRIGPAVMLADVDLATVESPMVERTATAHANRAGELNGVLVYFETELAEGELLSAHPDRSDASNSWTSHIWIAAHPVRLNPGDAFELTYRYGVPGRRQGVTVATAASCPMAKVA